MGYALGHAVEEIYDLVEKFAEGAWRVQQAGFDCVELHGAHGYLIAQFMSPYVNKRNDRFAASAIGNANMAFTKPRAAHWSTSISPFAIVIVKITRSKRKNPLTPTHR